MSGGRACQCNAQSHLHWRVAARNCNYSAFNGYHRTWSRYSAIVCIRCDSRWRTKAAYANSLRDFTEDERARCLRGEVQP